MLEGILIAFCLAALLVMGDQQETIQSFKDWRTYARENQCLESEASPGFWYCKKSMTYGIMRHE